MCPSVRQAVHWSVSPSVGPSVGPLVRQLVAVCKEHAIMAISLVGLGGKTPVETRVV